jgi:putative membrane protein
MFGYEFFFSYWWLFPLMMIIFCIFFMSRGCGRMMCGFDPHTRDNSHNGTGKSALEILDKRFAQGDINEDEYEEKKRKLTHK